MSASPVGPPSEGGSDTFLVAQNLMRLASSSWSSPTPESLEMALAVYQAASKLQPPPVYKTDVPYEVANLEKRLETVTEELRLTRQELQLSREETVRGFLALNERFDRLLGAWEGQSDRSDSVAESLDEEHQQSPPSTTPNSDVEPVSTEDITRNTVPVLEIPSSLDSDNIAAAEQTPAVEAISQTLDSGTAAVVAPEQRWTHSSVEQNKAALDVDSLDLVDRKVRVLLNKLASQNFDSVSDQIVDWVNRSEHEKNGGTLDLIIKLVFEKATDESHWAEMYARLCRKMMERISPAVQDERIRDKAGELIVGGRLFCKLLVNRCQKNFECGWAQTEASRAGGSIGKAPELGSDEYYTQTKAKRQGIGLVHFIGELFKLQMLTERIVRECIKRLLPSETDLPNPTEADIESLCQLLTTVGATLDLPESKDHMDGYFGRLQMVADNNNVSSRIRYMVQDIIELRQRHWRSRNADTKPPITAQRFDQVPRANLISVLGRRHQRVYNQGGSPLG